MKRLITLILIIAIGAGIAPFILPLKDGEPLLEPPEVSLPELPPIHLPDIPGTESTDHKARSDDTPPGKVAVYRWQDADGQWHFSSAPPEGVAAEKVHVSTRINIMPAPEESGTSKYDPEQSRTSPQWAPVTSVQSAPASKGANPYSMEGAQQLLEKARNVQELVDQRKAQQDQAVENLR